jgi:predicted O-linked N-acetylglucosamine transferase (SPINDLY family)
MSTDQATQIALRLHQRGDFQQAESIYRQIISVRPEHADALHLLGTLCIQTERFGEAVELLGRAISLRPDAADFHANLGEALRRLGRFDEAITTLRHALRLNANHGDAHTNLGSAFRSTGKTAEAIEAYRIAISLAPEWALPRYNLAVVLADARQPEEAIEAYLAAVQRAPRFAEAHDGLGTVLREIGRVDEAIAAHQRAIALEPNHAAAHANLATALKDAGRLDEALAFYRRSLQLRPSALVHSNLIYAMHFHSGSEAAIAEEQKEWARRYGSSPAREDYSNAPDPERRLRIGFVSPDFCDHVIGRNLLPLFQAHDPERFEIVCYADVPAPDALTVSFQSHADLWRPIGGLNDKQLAEQARADGIDVLVDLSQHLSGNRLRAFAWHPAPVQMSFAGYPATTGLPAIEYRLTDRFLERSSNDAQGETLAFLPHSFWCFNPIDAGTEVSGLPALSNGHVTFGCLNNFCKINGGVLALWSRVLNAVKDSRLLLLAPEGRHRGDTLAALAQLGVTPDRVTFAAPRPRREYLELYHGIDVALDTLPYNGHSTSLDALWMGVPVVSLVGESSLGRAGLSQLSNLGRTEWLASSAEEFVKIATDLAQNQESLRRIRSTLRNEMEHSPLMDSSGFARGIEQAIRSIWRRWCEQQA